MTKLKTNLLLLVTALVWAVSSAVATAGPQYVDETGYAASGYDPVAFFSLEQSAIGGKQPAAIPGKKSITAEWNGAKWAFATEENKALFLGNPEKYAPAYDGHCAYGLAKGGKVPGNPNLWRIVDGKLYFNINPPVVGFWEADIPGFIKTADKNWSEAKVKPASTQSWSALKNNKPTFKVLGPVE